MCGHVAAADLSCLRWYGTFLILLPFAFRIEPRLAVMRAHCRCVGAAVLGN